MAGASKSQDLWAKAFNTLSANDQKQFGPSTGNMLGLLKEIQKAAETNKDLCVKKGWTVYRRKNGEEIKLRKVLENISKSLVEIIKVVDIGVAVDKSFHATLPWAVVKYLISVGTNDITLFSSVVDGVESVAGLITRYTIIENLYLGKGGETTPLLQESVVKLYAAILQYLAKAKAYFVGNTLARFGRSLIELLRNGLKEMWDKISEIDVEKWVRLADAESQRKTGQILSRDHDAVMARLESIEQTVTNDSRDYEDIISKLGSIQLAVQNDPSDHDVILSKLAVQHEESSKQLQALKDILAGLDQPINVMAGHTTALSDQFTREKRKKVLEWISQIQYRHHHDEISKGLLPGSGAWLRDSPEFGAWVQSDTSSILWLHGIPGSGKTRLVSTVINHMLEDSSLCGSPIAFFYCKNVPGEPERGKPAEVLKAVLKQLASSKSDVPIKQPVAAEYEARRERAEEDGSQLKDLTLDDCTRLILQLTDKNPSTIIIDALDECEEHSRYELLESLDLIITTSVEVVKVLVSSRDDIDIKTHQISLSASRNSDDISNFIDSEVHRMISKKLLLDGNVPPELKEKIITTLNRKAQGMFTWVALSLETLRAKKFRKDFEHLLGKLPSKLFDLYDDIHGQIDQSDAYGWMVAIETFKWLLCAQRLMSTTEVIAAVTIGLLFADAPVSGSDDEFPGDQTQSQRINLEIEANTVTENDILRLCRNLVVIDNGLKVFRFAHLSVQEYLQRKPEYTRTIQHGLAAERCLDAYLIEAEPSFVKTAIMHTADCLKAYARLYWPVHYARVELQVSPDLEQKMLDFLMQDLGESSMSYINWASDITSAWSVTPAPSDTTAMVRHTPLGNRLVEAADSPFPLVAVCIFGFQSLTHLFGGYTDDDLNRDFKNGRKLLHFAAKHGNEALVRLLLERKVESDPKDDFLRTPLFLAAEQGHGRVAELLLENDANPDSEGLDKSTPLIIATLLRREEIIELLLRKGANPNLKDKTGNAALSIEVVRGSENTVKLLLKNKADPNTRGKGDLLVLSSAIKLGRIAVVKLLVENGADPNLEGPIGNTPLRTAIKTGSEETVQLLIKNAGVDVNSAIDDYYTPLSWALRNAHVNLVKYLLEAGADPNLPSRHGPTPMSAAIRGGSEELIRLLAEDTRVDVKPPKDETDTPLYWAVRNSSVDLVKLLLDRGADPDPKCDDWEFDETETPLAIAAYKGNEEIVKMLLAKNANPNRLSWYLPDGVTPLTLAWKGGHRHVARLLLENGADRKLADEEYDLETRSVQHQWIVQLISRRVARATSMLHSKASPQEP